MTDTKTLPEGFYLANNIADLLSEDDLDSLGATLKTNVKIDIQSRAEWLKRNDKWMELVTQVMEEKTYPWPNASNIKFPLIATAAVQFHARAHPSLLSGNKPVKARVVGSDPKNLKAERAGRVSTFMSYQVTDGMDGWMEDMDRLLFIVPIIGSIYKKTYYSERKGQNVSDIIHPRDLIINYDAIDIAEARKTHRVWYLPNTVKEMQLRGLWRNIPEEVEYPIQTPKVHSEPRDKSQGLNNSGIADEHSLQEFYEAHCLLDLDGDGYKEPYIATIREVDGKVYRVVANYDKGDMEYIGENLVAIHPKEFFTHYFFLPDPESATHGIGFGTMIGPINEAVNTIINQLTDAGHMHTLGGGFLSRGVRLKGGAVKFKPNEWKTVNTSGDDLRKGIVPLPTKEPSNVLFQMLGLLIDSGKDLSSVQDIMVGRNPGQNQPYSTTQAVVEQGMKVFNGIYKRLYRSMSAEFKKLYRLNQEHPDIETYMNILDMDGQEVSKAADLPGPDGKVPGIQGVLKYLAADFEASDIDIIPTAEPDMVAEMQKMQKANSLLEKRAQGIPLNVEEITKRILEAEGHENVTALMTVEPTPPPPDVVLDQKKFEHQQQIDGMELRIKQMTAQSTANLQSMQGKLALAQAMNEGVEGIHAQWVAQKKIQDEEFNSVTKRLKVLVDGKAAEEQRRATQQNAGPSSEG